MRSRDYAMTAMQRNYVACKKELRQANERIEKLESEQTLKELQQQAKGIEDAFKEVDRQGVNRWLMPSEIFEIIQEHLDGLLKQINIILEGKA